MRNMTAGLLRRHAREQSTYRTVTLIAKLEVAMCGLRNVCSALNDYSMLTALRLEHNCLRRLNPIHLPLLKVLSVHHNRLEVLGENTERPQRPGHDAPGAGEARRRAAKTSG